MKKVTLVIIIVLISTVFSNKLTSKADILIQAGHEGRKSGATGATGPLGNEVDWTTLVADSATVNLRQKGFKVLRVSADFQQGYKAEVKLALFIHFDGSKKPCSSKASVGYDDPTDQPAAKAWKDFYNLYWPFGFMPDNYTTNLSDYYGFSYTHTEDSELVLELGEITCLEQAEWLLPRLEWIGEIIAEFIETRLSEFVLGEVTF